MSTTRVPTSASLLSAGTGRLDITPPTGIYHRFWGAATHDRATGVHRPLYTTVLAIGEQSQPKHPRAVLVTLDHCLFRPRDMQVLREEAVALAGLEQDVRVLFTWSHTHSGGHICRDRADQPGGDMIEAYLVSLSKTVAGAITDAISTMQPARITYANASSQMGAHRDFYDPDSEQFVCGFNPNVPLDLPVQVGRIRNLAGDELATLVSYPCHPTTLAWENTLISPDYVGALRQTVEDASGCPCIFLLSPCGDIGPRHGFVGDTEVADNNGRQVGHAALSAWHTLSQAQGTFEFKGPVLSGATLGQWKYRGWDDAAADPTRTRFDMHRWTVPLQYRDDLADPDAVAARCDEWERQAVAEDVQNTGRASRARAMAERARREWERLAPLPDGDTYPFEIDAWRLGDALFVFVEGEPYYQLLSDIREAFPALAVFVVVLSEGSRCSYLPTREACEQPLYQVDVSLLKPGCLEAVRDAILAKLELA